MASQKSNSEVSGSEALRRKGNEIYELVSSGSYGPCILRHKLRTAHQLYEEALDAAGPSNSNEKSSCYKNLGTLNWLWGKAEWNIYLEEERVNEGLTAMRAAKQHISKAVEFHILALEFGELGNKPSIWLKQEEDTLTNIIEWVKEQLCKYNKCLEPILVELCITMENAGSTSSQRKKQLAATLFCLRLKQTIKCIVEDTEGIRMEETVYNSCISKIKDCNPPLVKAEGIVYSTKDKNLIKEFETLKEQVSLYNYICESVQARCQGDELLKKALLDSEELGVELVWNAIDWYRHSISLSKYNDLENNLESEAISLSRIGKVFSSVLKLDKQAHRYHYESVKIASTIMSPHIAESEWYKYSTHKLNEHVRKVEEEKAKELQEAINVIKREGENSAEAFLLFIYKEHSHPDPRKQVMGNIETNDSVKGALRKAILAYHPDRNAQYERDWQVLCEEISKILNLKCENFK